jgi:hypothetical protein
MLRFVLQTIVLLGACASAQPMVHGVTPGHRCDASRTQAFIGQPGTSATGAAIMRATRAAALRWAPPGYMLTMDYREDRVTVYLGADYKVTKISCG